jgi:hypothetical protein
MFLMCLNQLKKNKTIKNIKAIAERTFVQPPLKSPLFPHQQQANK